MAADIPKEMRAARVQKKGVYHYVIDTIPTPKPTGFHCLVKIGAAGLCHTDMMVMSGAFGDDFGIKYPVTGSHEPAGTVVALGDDAEREGKLKVGMRVAGFLHADVCYKCPDCTQLDWKYCPNSKYTGLTADGAFADYQILDSRIVVPIPDDISFEQAAPLTCAGVTIYTAIKRANLKPGQILAISGLGALGHLGVQMAKAMGLKVVGVDARPEPIAMTRSLKLAPDLCIDATKTSAEEAVKEIVKLRPEGYIGWDGVDAILLCADAAEAQRYAMDITRRHGLFVLVSQPPALTFAFNDFIFKDITVVGSLHGNDKDLAETVDLCVEHGIRSDVTCFKMDDHEAMVDSVHAEGRKGKSVMVM